MFHGIGERIFFCSFQWSRQVPSGPPAIPPGCGARRPELVQHAGATVGLHEHSGAYATVLACSCVLSLPHHDIETPVRFHAIPLGTHSCAREQSRDNSISKEM